MNLQPYLSPHDDAFDLDEALECWRWLLPEPVTLVAITAFGDLLLEREDGRVVLLDVIRARRSEVAGSRGEVTARFENRERVEEWFHVALVDELRGRGITLNAGECYDPKQSIFLGGPWSVENWVPTSWRVHFAASGMLAEEVKDLEPGTKITAIRFPKFE